MTNMNTRLWRAIPSLLVVALLALAAAAPAPPAAGPAPPPQLQPPCDDFAIAVAGADSVMLNTNDGVEQALPAGMSVAACSLRAVVPINSFMTLRLREWDPTTLAPDPDAITLRQTFFNGSSLWWQNGGRIPRVEFVPPIVVNSVPGVAEPPKPHVAMQLVAQPNWWPSPQRAFFTPEGPSELPAAVKLNADSTREPLPGPHPVLAHAVCAGDSDLAALRVVQSVSRADVKPFPAPKEFLQRFRVPQQTELRWIQLVLAELFIPYFQQAGDESMMGITNLPVLALIDGADMPTPVPIMPAPMVEARFTSFTSMSWITTQDFDRTVMLEPGHDYWIWVREAAASTFMNRRIHGDEPMPFTYGIGPYFGRTDSVGTWIRAADQVLVFRIVGKPTPPPPPPAPQPSPAAAAFALSTTPNPAPGVVRVDWSGAVGPVRFEVIDARGRRVSEGSGGAAGTWTWPGTDREGRAVASGIYFVRARDSAGQLSNQRVMIVR